MTVRFTWQPEEWREAWLLARRNKHARGTGVTMAQLAVGATLLGGFGDLLRAALAGGRSMLQDSLAPALLAILAVVLLMMLAKALRRHLRRFNGLPPQPLELQQVMVHEHGWFATEACERAARARPWSELLGQRTGRNVVALLTLDGSVAGVPLRVLTPDQGSWLQRMVQRKSQPLRTA